MRVRYLQPARAAIRHILATLYAEDPEAAARLVVRFDDAADRLARFPMLGREGKLPGTRELVLAHTPYILIYRLHAGYVEMLDVRHNARGS
ncbi:MAG: type II toxin-antitoxin system RelE/ParE family toxin [Chloroflexota bacterium]